MSITGDGVTNLDVVRRNKANKRKGAAYEIGIVDYLRAKLGGDKVERLVKTGRNDQGDATIDGADYTWVLEIKNEARIDLSGYMRELVTEVVNFASARKYLLDEMAGAVVVKRRGKPLGESYVVMTLNEFVRVVL